MAAGVPPHVTLVYPEEVTDEALLVERAHRAAEAFCPFTVTLGPVVADEDGHGGVFASVGDPTHSWNDLRQRILEPPFRRVDVHPHATIVHPGTSNEGPAAWGQERGSTVSEIVLLREFCLTKTDTETGIRVLDRFELR